MYTVYFPLLKRQVPLLYEQSMQYICSEVLVISASEERMISRVTFRDRISEEDARKRIAAQWCDHIYLLSFPFLYPSIIVLD